MPDVTREDIERLVQAHGRGAASLLPLLQAIQKVYNYLPEEALRLIPELTDIRAADVVGVATFYAGSRLCRVALLTITPPTSTGASRATG